MFAWLDILNTASGMLLTLCFSYQFFYIIYAIVRKPRHFQAVEQKHRYAVLISARNEEGVVGHLIDSIRLNDYPKDLVDIYVVADNCTDATAEISRNCGAFVYERFDTEKRGKGHALDYLMDQIFRKHGRDHYDGFFVFDADNLLDKQYITQMDRCFSEGHRVITSYRNSKNYSSNWISAGYALWFIREAKYLNNPRFMLNTSCAISGTGFLVHKDIIQQQGGWRHFLLTEDIEFTVDNVIQNEKVAYCHDAMLYDEQPTSFRQSWRQRLRWSKGFLQVTRKYGTGLIKSIFRNRSFSAFDMLMTICPAYFITVTSLFINFGVLLYSIIINNGKTLQILGGLAGGFCGTYLLLFGLGLITLIGEWKQIHCPAGKKILYCFTFPFFMLTYIPISVHALFAKVEWKPINHTCTLSVEDMEKDLSKV